MKSLRWMTIFALVAGVSMLTACGSDDNSDGAAGSGGSSAAGSGGSSAAGTGGSSAAGTGGSSAGAGGSSAGAGGSSAGAGGSSAGAGGSSAGAGGSSAGAGGSAQGGAGGAASCNAMAKEECLGCCATAYAAEWDTYQTKYAAPCVCQDDANGKTYCKTECGGTLCAATPATPDAACQACMNPALNVGGSCFSATGDCMKDTKCGPVVQCMLGCK